MAYEDEIHIPQSMRSRKDMRELGRKALLAVQDVIREAAGAGDDPRPTCLGCTAGLLEEIEGAMEEQWKGWRSAQGPRIAPQDVDAFLRALMMPKERETVRV